MLLVICSVSRPGHWAARVGLSAQVQGVHRAPVPGDQVRSQWSRATLPAPPSRVLLSRLSTSGMYTFFRSWEHVHVSECPPRRAGSCATPQDLCTEHGSRQRGLRAAVSGRARPSCWDLPSGPRRGVADLETIALGVMAWTAWKG